MPPFDVLSVVLCDDVRQENNGKHILIGVYLRSVFVEDFPTNISLTMWIEFTPSEVGEFPGEIRVIKDDESVLLRGSVQITTDNLEPVMSVFKNMPLEFQGGGNYSFQWKFGDREWQTVKEFSVRKRSIK